MRMRLPAAFATLSLLLAPLLIPATTPSDGTLTIEDILRHPIGDSYSAEVSLIDYGATLSRDTKQALEKRWRHGGLGAKVVLFSTRDVTECITNHLKAARFRRDSHFPYEPRYCIVYLKEGEKSFRIWADPDGNILGESEVYVLQKGGENWLKQMMRDIGAYYLGCPTIP